MICGAHSTKVKLHFKSYCGSEKNTQVSNRRQIDLFVESREDAN